jgi:hypothetical protein
VTLLFADPPPGERFLRARTLDQHGGQLEVRTLRASATLAAYLQTAGWPDAGRVLEGTATVRWPRHPAKETHGETGFFLTSLPAQTRPAQVQTLGTAALAQRESAALAARCHLGRRCLSGARGACPAALAGGRNAVLGLLRQRRVGNLAATLRANAWTGGTAALSFLGLNIE